jgi:hypothetical protein
VTTFDNLSTTPQAHSFTLSAQAVPVRKLNALKYRVVHAQNRHRQHATVWMAREIGASSDDDRSLGYASSWLGYASFQSLLCFFLALL